MVSDTTLSKLIGLIYGAAADPTKWEMFLAQAAELFEAHVATIHFQDTASAACGFNVEFNMDGSYVNSYIQHFAAINPYMKRTDLQQEGKPFVRRQMVETPALLKTEFFNDWLRPQDLFDSVAGTIFRRGLVTGNVTFWRGQNATPCGEHEKRTLDLLMPHLVRAIQLHQRIAGLERRCDALCTALDMIHHPVLLLDGDGKVMMTNGAAKTVLHRSDGLRVKHDFIEAELPQQTSAIRRAVRCAADCAEGRVAPVCDLIVVSRPSLRRPFLIWVAPLVAGALADRQETIVAVFVIDPDAQPANPEQALRRLFGLTGAEARLANALLQGGDLTAAADRFGTTRNTARSQLQSIFAKTSTSRQGELIRLLAKLGSISACNDVEALTGKPAA